MIQDRQALQQAAGIISLPLIEKGHIDLTVLKYMAQRVLVTLHSVEQTLHTAETLLYYLDERHRRTHRMAIYRPQELRQNNALAFVGFVSGKQKSVHPAIVEEIERIDKRMVQDLQHIPGILSYSSLELRTGNWWNLVLLRSSQAKEHLLAHKTHAYAAYQLSPHYYEWIRLHNGSMPGGLAHNELVLRSTKYYTFHPAQERPTIRTLTYS